jgi:hypothetical protein
VPVACVALLAAAGAWELHDPTRWRETGSASVSTPTVESTVTDEADGSRTPDVDAETHAASPAERSSANAEPCEGSAARPAGAAALPAVVARIEASGPLVAVAYINGEEVVSLGSLGVTAAWSTSKVPLAFAVVQAGLQAAQSANLKAALRSSDNASAAALWHALGTNAVAAQKVTVVLRQAGDTTTKVPSTATYAPYSVFGQTMWSVEAQARFMKEAPCLVGAAAVLSEMAQVDPSQRWGMGRLTGAVFKGGWGPPKSGGYEARQLGWYEVGGAKAYVAMSVRASSFSAATNALDLLIAGLRG